MKIKIAISRCLLGENVRYDGTAKYCSDISTVLDSNYELIPFCPEVEIGMGIPRLPIQLDKVDGTIRARRRDDISQDYTKLLRDYATQFHVAHPDLVAVINKKGSPSCGYQTTKLYCNDEIVQLDESGIFIAELKRLITDLLIVDETGLSDAGERSAFINQLKQKSPE